MKKFNYFSILRQGKLFLLALLAWFTMQPAWSQDKDYLCFTATENGTTIQLTNNKYSKSDLTTNQKWIERGVPNISLQYSKNGNTWTDFVVSGNSNAGTNTKFKFTVNSISLNAGEKVYIRAKNSANPSFSYIDTKFTERTTNTYTDYDWQSGHYVFTYPETNNDRLTGNFWHFTINRPVECSGNIMYLLNRDNPTTTVPNYAFAGLFNSCYTLLSAPTLPATALGEYCYYGMFFQCSRLTSAPALPATVLQDYCYSYMFAGCAALQSMDVSFPSFTPENATKGWACSTIQNLPNYYVDGNYYNITSYNYFPAGGLFTCETSLTSNYQTGESYIPTGWTVSSLNNDYLRFAWETGHDGNWFEPDLKATIRFVRNSEASYDDYPTKRYTEPQLQYSKDAKTWTDVVISDGSTGGINMAMNEILYFRAKPGGNKTISYDNTLYYYFNINLIGKDSYNRDTKVSGKYGGILDINGNIMSLLDQKCIRTDVPDYCFYRLFAGATKGNTTDPTGKQTYFGPLVDMFGAPQLPAIDLGQHCYEEMFKGCKNLTNAPALPATTNDLSESLSLDCYKSMFQNCARLEYIKVGFDKWTITDNNNSEKPFTTNWVSGVNTTAGTFVCPEKLPHTYDNSHIPTNWNNNTSTVGSTEEEYDWLCFETENTTATVQLNRSNESHNTLGGKLQYSLDDGVTWNTYTWSGTKGKIITLSRKNNTDRVYFRSTVTDNDGRCNESFTNYYQFSFSGNIGASGNIMSLLRQDCRRFDVGEYEFLYLFYKCPTLKTAPSLPATQLRKGCYERMFASCTTLSTPPELPAKEAKKSCYALMFYGCTALTSTPELPATILAENCYEKMFLGCTNITSAPELPATVLADNCYIQMFENCSKLSYINVGFSEWHANATNGWTKGVSETGSFYCPSSLPKEYNTSNSFNRIPYLVNSKQWPVFDNTNAYLSFEAKRNGTTIQLNKVASPDPISLLYSIDNGSTWQEYTWNNKPDTISMGITYYGNTIQINRNGNNRVIFKAGSKTVLNKTSNNQFSKDFKNFYYFTMKGSVTANGSIISLLSQDLTLDTIPDNAFCKLFYDCKALQNCPTLPAIKLGAYCYQFMFTNCNKIVSAPDLPAMQLNVGCYKGMFSGCLSLTTAPKLNATKMYSECYMRMFENNPCLTIAPTLPATVLASNCYTQMFKGCETLEYMNVGFKTWHTDATTNWVSDGNYPFHNTGVFMCPKELAENPVYGPNRIPKNDTYTWYVNVAALRFTAEDGGATIKLNKYGKPTNVTLQYSLNNAISWDDLVFGEEIYVAKGQNIYIQAKNDANAFSTSESDYYQFVINGMMSVSGDVTTLYKTSGNISSIPNYAFYKLFSGCTGLKNLPTITRPNIPVGEYSHAYMFENCTSILEAPDSLSLTLSEGCYKGTFKGCTKIEVAPVLPAKNLDNNCYEELFANCSLLQEISVDFNSWHTNATKNWVNGVSSTGIFMCPESLPHENQEHFNYARIPLKPDSRWDVNPTYVMFTGASNATIALNRVGMPDTVMLVYSTDLRKWMNYSWNEEQGTALKLSAGQKLYFKAKDINATFSQSEDKYYQFVIQGEVAVNGYATYLLSRTNRNAVVPAYGFYNLFKDCSTITSAPAPTANIDGNSTINAHAYESMYEGCSSITTIPCELPSMNLGVACYKNMFKGCTNLVATMASLPAPNNIAESCYEGMFEGCENITAAPNIAWTAQPKVATFKAMFKDCKSLVNNLPTQLFINNWGLAESCYESLFEGCESMNSKIDLPAQGFENSCYKALFKDCKSLTSDNMPVIGVSTNGWTDHTSAMESMFEGCESLTYNPIEFDYIFTNINYPIAVMKNMFKGCTNLTEPLPSYISNSTLSESCFEGMYENCTSLTKAPALGQTQLANRCYYRMFAGCTSLKNAPVLPANKDQLKDSCYAYMFNGCEKLRYMDVAFSEWHLDDLGATFMWVENVSAKGTFMCPFELDKQFDESHIPNGWSADDNGNYLCFSKEGSNSLTLSKVGNPTTITVSYSKDKKKSWEHLNVWSPTIYFTDTLYIKISEGALSTSTSDYWYFQSSNNLSVSGNIMSLLDATMEETAVPDYAFYKLFSGCPNITDISELELPATELGAYAYAKMFDGCTTLKSTATATPELPATTLGAYCYQNLFEGWTALTSAPKLPATTLEQGCYSGMFKGCTSLTTAPVLPATTLVNDCYDSLFDGCKKLNSIDVAFTAWVEGATDNWVNDVAYSGDLLCPWSLAQSAKNKWVTGSNYDNAYGGSKIPRDKDHKWIILTHTDMEFNYRTGELSIAGGNTIYWSTDESLAFDNCTTVGTRVDSEPAIVDCNEWLSATTTGLDSITYYALALTGDDDGFTKPTVNSLTIYRHPKKIDMCICDTEEKIETALYYARKVSSANYPIKVFIADGEYDFGNKSIEVGEYVSVIGESLNGTILKSSSDKGALNIKGNDAYLQDMKLVNTGTGAAFTNKGQRTTLHVAMEGYYNEGGMSKHYLPEAWDRATDLTQATVTSASINGSTISLTSNAKYFLVRIDEKYSFASSKDFYIVESLVGKTVTIRAANNRGAFGEPITPNLIEPNGSKSDEFSVKLNGYGYSSFCFDDDNIDQLQVIGASVYKGIYRDGAVYLIRLNEHDIVPKRTGVILAGLQNSTVSFYENNSVVLSDEERNPYNYLPDEKCIGMSGNWSTETIVNNGHNYYVLSNNYGGFKPLKKDGGTIKPNKAYFDLGNSTNAATIRIVFGMWEDEEEEVVSGINYLPTTSNDSEYGYTLTGVRTKDAKGLVIQNNKVVLVK